MRWYRRVSADPSDLSPVADAMVYFQGEYEQAVREFEVKGTRIDGMAARIPGVIAHRFAQYQEVETILKYIEEIQNRAVIKKTQWYMENYPRSLSEANAKKYAEADDEVFTIALVKFEVATVRNNFLALFKGLEALHYQIRNIVELRKVGLDDAEF